MMKESDGGVGDDVLANVVIVGGGSAGWLAAARIAARNRSPESRDVTVTLVESAVTPPIGVGEGTWPTMRNTLRKIGISETDFIRRADAAFKQGAKFVAWTDGSAADAYYHPLNPPVGAGELNLSPHWRHCDGAGPESFAERVDFQAALCEAGLAPKLITSPEYGGVANYAYHLDAGKFAELLREHAIGNLGVRHVVDDVVGVTRRDNGDIRTLRLASGAQLPGDLFVDCSGFQGILIGGVFGSPLRSRQDVLFADRALAMQVPYPDPDQPITCHTVSTAQDAGWIWDIGLWSRRGVGYVYSSAHTTDEEAEHTLRRYVGAAADGIGARRLTINAGQRQVFWQNNCVAVGLSAGFLEPLEASALMLIEVALDSIADRLPRTRGAMDVLARQFNAAFDHHWERIVEFLKLHYVLTRRPESYFWGDNGRRESIPDTLWERLRLWQDHPPSPNDFPFAREVFSWPSYQYILHGMGHPSNYERLPTAAAERPAARRLLDRAARSRGEALRQLPAHRSIIAAIRQQGLQAV